MQPDSNISPETLFFESSGLDREKAAKYVKTALFGAEDGELFLEHTLEESLLLDDGKLKNASFRNSRGLGLRAVDGDLAAYAHASEISEPSLKKAVETIGQFRTGYEGVTAVAASPQRTNQHRYEALDPLHEVPFEKKIALLGEIDSYLRAKDPRVKQVSASLYGEWQAVMILRADGQMTHDIRPLVRLNVSVVAEENGRMERGSSGAGGRVSYMHYMNETNWKKQADEALRQAVTNLTSVPAPAGAMTVVCGPGWPGVLLHEAVGHGLEGDFNRKKTSVFSDLLGKQVAAKGVTVVDDGTIEGRRGSITIDDEGTPSSCTTLIEDGILVGYLQDRMNARLMGVKPTGNGRRENYASLPMPRMTNTFMLAGKDEPQEIIRSVKNGIYAVNFGGGQVDITSGRFVFSASEAYKIENGVVTVPVKGATLIGSGAEVLKNIRAIGNDLKLDDGVGTCGKDGQSVPVGVGQPTLLIENLTVGGTEV